MALCEAMASYGGEHAFPSLRASLPTGNGGSVTAVDSARCLAEIDRLGDLMSARSMVCIVDADTDVVVFVGPESDLVAAPRHHAPEPAGFRFDERAAVHGLAAVDGSPMTSTWLGGDAVVRVHDADGSLLFAARAFVQERAGEDWIFRDDQIGVTMRHCSPVGWWDGLPNENEPHRMRAEIRPVQIDDYLPGVAELRELFEASVHTGRPVHWM